MLYRFVPVWRRLDGGTLVVYRCFEVLGHGFVVQSRDNCYPERSDCLATMSTHDLQFLRLLAEEAPERRSSVHACLQSAIESFDAAFGNQ